MKDTFVPPPKKRYCEEDKNDVSKETIYKHFIYLRFDVLFN